MAIGRPRSQALGRYNYLVNRTSQTAARAVPSAAPPGRILAIDYGRARIGLAIADSLAAPARPLATVERINRNQDMRRLREFIRDHSVRLVLVGLPLRLDGTPGEAAEEAERFARRVQKQIGVAVEMADERLTSWEAERQLEELFGRRSKSQTPASKKKGGEVSVDSMAATIILRDYLDRQAASKEAR
jgi:putative Holliday junction resolvase